MARKPKQTGDEAPPFVSKRQRTSFGRHVEEMLRRYDFEPGLSPIAEKWARTGIRTVLIARIHSWSPHLVEFYLENSLGDLIEAGRSDERSFDRVFFNFIETQDSRESGAKGFSGVDDVSASCDMGAHERCRGCACGCHGEPIIKRCGCGRSYTQAEWDALPLLGKQVIPAWRNEPEEILEMKNCPCRSTLAVSNIHGG